MAARPAHRSASRPSDATPVNVGDLPPLRPPARSRVVSVSPDDAALLEARPPTPARPADGGDVFLTPRVLDQAAFNDLAGTLRGLIEEATQAADRLDERLEAARRSATAPEAASTRLQERLRLGARMLKAFQSQIDRAEAAIGLLDEHRRQTAAGQAAITQRPGEIELRFAEFEQRAAEITARAWRQVDNAVEEAARRAEKMIAQKRDELLRFDHVEGRIGELTRDAIQQIESRLAQRDATFEATGERLDQLRRRVDGLAARLKDTEANAGALSQSANDSSGELQARVAETRRLVRQCDEVRTALNDVRAGAEARVDELAARCERLEASIRRRLVQASSAWQRMGRCIGRATAATRSLKPGAELAADICTLLAELEPWKRLLLETERDEQGVPRPVGRMVEGLRTGIGLDMARISATMRELARQVDDLGLPVPADESSPRTGADEEDDDRAPPVPQIVALGERGDDRSSSSRGGPAEG
jgi:DNA repair exonuclease SbcCD ATPase subunit